MKAFVIRIREYRDFQLEVEAANEHLALDLAEKQRRVDGLESWDETDSGELPAEVIYALVRP